jgi:hypothetical protein
MKNAQVLKGTLLALALLMAVSGSAFADKAAAQQVRKDYHSQIATLKDQRKAAVQSGNKEQAKELSKQIKDLKKEKHEKVKDAKKS